MAKRCTYPKCTMHVHPHTYRSSIMLDMHVRAPHNTHTSRPRTASSTGYCVIVCEQKRTRNNDRRKFALGQDVNSRQIMPRSRGGCSPLVSRPVNPESNLGFGISGNGSTSGN